MQLDCTQDDEISDVSYCLKDELHQFVKVHQKHSTDRETEKYYELYRMNSSTMLLKVENMEEGDYTIKIKTGTNTREFNVKVDCKKIDNFLKSFPLKYLWNHLSLS